MYEKMATFVLFSFFFFSSTSKIGEESIDLHVHLLSDREKIFVENNNPKKHRRLEGLTLQLISHPTATLSLTI